MNKRRWLIAILSVLAVGALPLETSTHVVRGWWRGEAFYRARPTSFWSHDIHHWRHIPET